MTTRIHIHHDGPGYKKVRVETLDPETGKTQPTAVLSEGWHYEAHVHSGYALRVNRRRGLRPGKAKSPATLRDGELPGWGGVRESR